MGTGPEQRRPAGAPEQERRPAGMPAQEEEAPQASAEEQQVQADFEELLGQTKQERDQYLDLAQRTKADFENYRKRVAGEADAARKRGRAELAGELVPVLDNLERALAAAGIDPATALGGGDPPEGSLEQGVVLTYRDLHGTLERAGVEAYDPSGERFDPEWHEALSTRPGDGAEAGTVLDVVQKGYRLDGQLIRAARVVVSE